MLNEGIAIDENAAFAVEHGAARGDDGNVADAVLFGEVGKMVGLDDLQFPEADQKHGYEDDGQVGKQGEPSLRNLLIANAPWCQRNSNAAGRMRP